jgi:hypothetical protein
MPHLLINDQAHPIVLLNFLLQKYGHGCLEWPPSVLKKTVQDDFNLSMSRVNVTKFLAAAAVATRDDFWTRWEVFHFLCQGLNGVVPDAESLNEHTVGQMMVAVDIATQIRKDLKELGHPVFFTEEVARYVAAQALHQGIWYLPEPLHFAEKYASKKWYHCNDCGNDSEVFSEDGLCDFCSGRFNTDKLGGWYPNPALLKQGGKNIKVYFKNPIEAVKTRFEQVKKTPDSMLQDTQTDICVAKLMAAYHYLEGWRERLETQRKEL